jgi:5'(3')-deoxyribonucleotidase
MVIGVDIDEPLFPFCEQFALWASISTKRPLSDFPQPTKWEFADEWGLTEAEWLSLFHSFVAGGKMFAAPIVRDYAILALESLARQHDIVFVTSRGADKRMSRAWNHAAKKQTLKWLGWFGMSRHPLIFAHDKRIARVDVLIDDGLHHLNAVECRGICWDTGHNQEWTGERVKSWLEVETLLIGESQDGNRGNVVRAVGQR